MRCPGCGFFQKPESLCKRCGASLQMPSSPAARYAPDGTRAQAQKEAAWDEEGWGPWLNELLFYVPAAIDPIAFYGRVLLYVVFLIWGLQFIAMDHTKVVGGYPPINQSFMHTVNLVFHEAGHVLFAPFGRFMMVLGGTLGQWLIPFIVMCAFVFKTRDTFAATVGLWWLGQSFMDAAPYINDARAEQLVLLGGVTGRDVPGYHDWNTILRDLGWLQYDHTIAAIVNAIGIILMLASFAWGAYVLTMQQRHLSS